jgi:hypothetical protein
VRQHRQRRCSATYNNHRKGPPGTHDRKARQESTTARYSWVGTTEKHTGRGKAQQKGTWHTRKAHHGGTTGRQDREARQGGTTGRRDRETRQGVHIGAGHSCRMCLVLRTGKRGPGGTCVVCAGGASPPPDPPLPCPLAVGKWGSLMNDRVGVRDTMLQRLLF